jgi:hypothetical protein
MRAITRVPGTLDVTPSHSIVEEVNGKTSQFVMWMTLPCHGQYLYPLGPAQSERETSQDRS